MTGHSDGRPGAGLPALLVRRSTEDDRAALARLAQLDSAPPPHGGYLLAEEGGELRAAVSIEDGTVLADPFRRGEDLVAALQLRAARLRTGPGELPGGVAVRIAAWLRRALGADRSGLEASTDAFAGRF